MKAGTKRFFRVVLPLTLMALVILASYTYCHRDTKEQVLMQVVTQTLSMAHFNPLQMNDDFSEKVYSLFIKRLDYGKRFFTKEDLKKLEVYKTKIDDEILNSNFEFYAYANTLFDQQVNLVQSYYQEILAKPFDFSVSESYQSDPDKAEFALNNDQLKEYWRKMLKYQILVRLNEMVSTQEMAKTKNDTVKVKTFAENEADARKKVLKIYDESFKSIKKDDANDKFSLFVNAVTSVYDPHTVYLPPRENVNFNIRMSGQLEGIGALLQESEGYVKIVSIVPGSPSWLQGDLKANDLILKVTQENQIPVDILDMKISDVVNMIRGKKGTKVTLTVKKLNGTIKPITITRDVVIIEDTYAKSAILSKSGTDEKYGYIYLPEFYVDFEKTATGRSCADDVAKELQKLKKEDVKGIVLDLRENGGGSLPDAVKMAGLFIQKGPIVQVKAKVGPTRVLEDTDPTVQYGGPLVVLVNSFSASASEILAAAMQDYRRAIIIGTPSTFGKGTVQTKVDLDEQVAGTDLHNLGSLGSLLVTIQKFYRINGGATQLKGVTPDIIIPDAFSDLEMGEREQDYYMPWTKIDPVNYTKWNGIVNFDKIVKKETAILSSDPDFNILKEESKTLKKQKDETVVSLKMEDYKKAEKFKQENSKRFEELSKKENGLDIKSLAVDISQAKNDTSKMAQTQAWIKELKKDIVLKEAFNVVAEIGAEK
jgi:carboxyl-terminal processing protease